MVVILRCPLPTTPSGNICRRSSPSSTMPQHWAMRGLQSTCHCHQHLQRTFRRSIMTIRPVRSLGCTIASRYNVSSTRKLCPTGSASCLSNMISFGRGCFESPNLLRRSYQLDVDVLFSAITVPKYHSDIVKPKNRVGTVHGYNVGGDIDRLLVFCRSNKCRSIATKATDDEKPFSTMPIGTVNESCADTKDKSSTRKSTLENGKKVTGKLKEKKPAAKKINKALRGTKSNPEKNDISVGENLHFQDKIFAAEVSPSLKKSTKSRRSKPSTILNEETGGLTNDTSIMREKQHPPLYPPSARSVVIVESVTKAKVIQKYLGDMFEVLPSYGHVRALARRSGSVRPEDDFIMTWEVTSAAWTHLRCIIEALNGAKNIILASDPDREGEAIAWHIKEMLSQQDALTDDINIARVTFYEITETAIKTALTSPRNIDMDLVNAYLARCALDYLIGFNISPLLWRKLPGCRSAGRVQSSALALICDREAEIEQFIPQEYWTVEVDFQGRSLASSKAGHFSSRLTQLNQEKLNQLSICSELEADAIKKFICPCKFEVVGLKMNLSYRNPPMPYITSTLQQDAANRLQFPASHTMKVAQRLYEGVKLSDDEATGLITYMRTDGSHVSDEAAEDIHSLVEERYGPEYASRNTRKYFKKVKNAQEAHEAIRPTSIRRLPSSLAGVLDDDSLKLYTLIWARTMVCQMEAARNNMVQVEIGNAEGNIVFHAVGSRAEFAGYKAVYKDVEIRDCWINDYEDNSTENNFDTLSKLKVKDPLSLAEVHLEQHYTKAPSRYTEGSLVKKLEELGIGRPSTYASTMKVLQDRKYVMMKSRVLHPEFRGRMVSAFLSHYFTEVVDYSFTAEMETQLDNVSAGTTKWKSLLKDYWERFRKYCDAASNVDIREIEKMLENKFSEKLYSSCLDNNRVCPSCSEGKLTFKLGKYGDGYFIACDRYPTCKYTASAFHSEDEAGNAEKSHETPPKLLGILPGSKEKVYLKNGPYGYYVQLGEDRKTRSPKRVSINKDNYDVSSMTLDDAIELLRYPITLGDHPDDNQPVLVTRSKYGYSIKHRRTFSKVPKDADPKMITLEVALEYLKSKRAKKSGRRKSSSVILEAL